MEKKEKINEQEDIIEEEEKTEEAASEAAEETVEETDKTAEYEEKLKESEDKYLRLYAEFDNYKKRTEKEKSARYADALIDTVAEFLPILDNLERALAAEAASDAFSRDSANLPFTMALSVAISSSTMAMSAFGHS